MSNVHRRIAGATVLLLVIAVVISAAAWFIGQSEQDLVQGEVDATEVKVSAKIAGRVVGLLVREGDQVNAHQVLVRITSPEIEARFTQAEAAQQAALAQSAKAEKGARDEEIRQAEAMWLRTTRAAELAESTFVRLFRLHHDRVVPRQRLDEAEAAARAAHDAQTAARAAYDMALSGARVEDRQAAAALSKQASGVVSEVEVYLGERELVSPVTGEVAVVVVEEGELVGPGYPLVTVVDLDDIWVTFNLREDRLAKIRLGTRLEGLVPALDNRKVALEVEMIAAAGDYATWRATTASGGFDLKTFEVRARPVVPVEGLRPGMSVIVDWTAFIAGGGNG